MQTWILGDVHGAALALEQCLEKANFDRTQDRLIFLGDVCDGWPETRQCIDILLDIENLVALRGNHDQWAIDYYDKTLDELGERSWKHHGGGATIASLSESPPARYLNFLKETQLYYEEANQLFVHAGYNPAELIHLQDETELLWSRSLVRHAHQMRKMVAPGLKLRHVIYDRVWVGHTPTIYFNEFWREPKLLANVLMCDTGAAFTGKLSMINQQTDEVVQSDVVARLYPNDFGRNSQTWANTHKF